MNIIAEPVTSPTVTTHPIGWTQITGGPHLGCTEVSPGCVHCYARELAHRWYAKLIRAAYRKAGFEDWETRPIWGNKAPRVRTKGFWDQARAMDRKARRNGQRVLWFPSLIDWLDDMPAGLIDQHGSHIAPVRHLADFLDVIAQTPAITWQLLTKRPQDWQTRLGKVVQLTRLGSHSGHILAHRWLRGDAPKNVWIGCTAEDQARANERIPHLCRIPAVVRFLSVEPMLGPVQIGGWDGGKQSFYHFPAPYVDEEERYEFFDGRLHLVICGGESGAGARPMDPQWARDLRDECRGEAAFFMKQMGGVRDKRDALEDLPEDLRIREFPEVESEVAA